MDKEIMLMLYFSGTGNSKYVAELFASEMKAACHSIEDAVDFGSLISESGTIAFCYPVYMSRVPRIMREFVSRHLGVLKGKKTVIFCTQLILSGDGARSFAALFPKNHALVIYAEHFFMPNNVSNVPVLPMPSENTINKCMDTAKRKMEKVCEDIRHGKVRKRGFNLFSRLLGLPQGVFITKTEQLANNSFRADADCTVCGLCVRICPTNNLAINDGKITHNHNCTMCYRCINQCPKKAIRVLLRGKVKKQYKGTKKSEETT